MPNLHEIAVSLVVKAEQLEAGFKKGADASKHFEADIGALQNRLGQTGAAGAKATTTALTLEAAFLKAQGGAKRLEAEMGTLQKKLGEPGAQRTAEATLKLEAAFLKAQGGAKRLDAEMAKLQQQQTALARTTTANTAAITKSSTAMTTSSTGINPLIAGMKSLALTYISAQAAIQGVSAAFAASASVERQERAWKGIAGSVAGGRQEIEFVRTSADKLGVSFTSLEEGYRKVASSSKGTSLEGAVAKQIFTDIAVTMQALGSSSDDVAGAMHTLGQMISTGVVQADELRNELGNRLPNVMGIAAKSTNMTTQEFRKLQETGAVITADFLPNFAKMMRSTYVPAVEAGGKVTLSLEQEAERAKNVLQQLAAIGVKETGIEGWLKRVLSGLTEIGKEAVKSSERLNAMRGIDAERIKTTVTEAAGGVALSPKATAAAAQEVQRLERQMETTFAAMQDLMRRQEDAVKAGVPFPEALTRALAQAEKAFLAAQANRNAFLAQVPTMERRAAVPMPGEGSQFAAEQYALSVSQAAKVKAAGEEMKALRKSWDDLGVAGAAAGKTPLEVLQEQLKQSTADTEKFALKYKEVMHLISGTGAAAPGIAAPGQSSGASGTYTTAQIKAMIKSEAERQGVSPRLALAVAMRESNLDPNIVGDNGKSLGLFQLQRDAAIDAGIDPATRGQVENNILGGITYLRQKLMQSKGDERGALLRYNGGGDPNYINNVYEQMATLPPDVARSADTLARGQETLAAKQQELLRLAAAEGIELRVTSGQRTAQEQAALYAQGRTTPGAIVTNAPPGTSRHETGQAFDVAIFKDGKPDWESPAWDRVGALGKSAGLTWGGDFRTIKDRPHFELPASAEASLSAPGTNLAVSAPAPTSIMQPALDFNKGLQDKIGGSQANLAVFDARRDAIDKEQDAITKLAEKFDTLTTAEDAALRAQTFLTLEQQSAAGDTHGMTASLAKLEEQHDLGNISLNKRERALALVKLESMGLYTETEALAASALKASYAFDDEATSLEAGKKVLPEWTEYTQELIKANEKLAAVEEKRTDAIDDIIAQMKAGVSPIRDMVTGMTEFEELYKRLQGLGAQPTTLQVAEGLRQQSSVEFQAIKDGAADMASDITSTLTTILSGGKVSWEDFGNTAIQTMIRIMLQATEFEAKLTKALTNVGLKLLELLGGTAAGGSSGDIDFAAGSGSSQPELAQGGFLGAGQNALTGEKGRELMLSGGRMRLVGLHGPEVVRSREAAFVIPHQQTMTLLRKRGELDNVVHTMARRQFGGSVNAGQTFLGGEAGVEGVVSRGGQRGQGSPNITVNINGVKDLQSFTQPRSQAEIQRALARTLQAAQGST